MEDRKPNESQFINFNPIKALTILAEAERWTTGKALWKMFENWCIDDDEEGGEP